MSLIKLSFPSAQTIMMLQAMIMKKKQILSATLIIALGAAVAVNWYYTENPIDTTSKETTTQSVSGSLGDSLSVGSSSVDDIASEEAQSVMANSSFFAAERLKREETYDDIIESIEQIAQSESISDEQGEKMEAMLDRYSRNIKTQSDTESLISAKTGSDCIVVINGEICQVILEKNTLNDTVILQITEIIEKNTNISAKNLTIIEAK